MPRNFWMIVCNQENFQITKGLDFSIQGLKSQYRRKVQRVESGDRLLFYVSGIRRFTATVTVTSSYIEEDTTPWKREGSTGWPYQVGIKPEIILNEEQYIQAGLLAHRLDYVRRWPPENWYMAFQGNLHLLPKNDFFLIEEEMKKLKLGRHYQPTVAAQPAAGEAPHRGRRSGPYSGRPRRPRATEAGRPAAPAT